MLPIAGQTAGSNGLKLFVDTQGWPGCIRLKKFEFFNIFFQHFFLKKNSLGNARLLS